MSVRSGTFSNSQGFSLLEVIIAMGLASMVMLATASLNFHSARSAKSEELGVDWVALTSTLATVLNSPACTTTLAGKPLDLSKLPVSLDPLTMPGGPLVKVGEPSSGVRVTAIEIDKVLEFDVRVLGLLRLHLVSIRLGARKVNASGPLPGVPTLSKSYVVAIWQNVETGTITSCHPS